MCTRALERKPFYVLVTRRKIFTSDSKYQNVLDMNSHFSRYTYIGAHESMRVVPSISRLERVSRINV